MSQHNVEVVSHHRPPCKARHHRSRDYYARKRAQARHNAAIV